MTIRFLPQVKQTFCEQIIIHILNQLFILFSGGYDQDAGVYSDKILLLDEETTTFKEIGKLEQRRSYPSMSVVDINDFICS